MNNYNEDETLIFNNRHGELLKITKKYKAIELRRNQLKTIPDILPENIEYLDISDNLIQAPNIEKFTSLKVLDLGYNLLLNHNSIKNKSLVELYLMSNDILEISSSIIHLTNLKKFDIANNRISNLDILHYISPTIEELYLGNNKIKEFTCNLTHLTRLRVLDLQFNNLTEFDCSLLPSSVEVLLLNNNYNLKLIKNKRFFELIDTEETKVTSKSLSSLNTVLNAGSDDTNE